METKSTEDVVALRYMQRGKAKRKRIQRYRKNKQRSKMQGKRWRQRNRAHLKRYRQKAKRNPMKHRLKRRAGDEPSMVPIDRLNFFDYHMGEEGIATGLNTDDAEVNTSLGVYGIDDFVNSVVFLTEEEEESMFGLLDDLADDGVIDDVYVYDRSDLPSLFG